jgi:putative hydrolase of the HAD superfamily
MITALFFDVGGVLATNGWDRDSRRLAVSGFQLDPPDFDRRHGEVVDAFDAGRMTLDAYLDHTVFHVARSFSRQEFVDFMRAQSMGNDATLAVAARLSSLNRFFMATLNNESLDLNAYRIQKFGLRRYFSAFFSSCYLGIAKPDERIFRLAMNVAQRPPGECLFIDDRLPNVDAARRCGMRGIHYEGAPQLEAELSRELT